MSDAVAEAVNVAQQARSVMNELGSDVGRYMARDLARFEASLPAFEAERQELESVLAETAAVSRGTPSAAAAKQASALRAQANTRLVKLDEKAAELRSTADRISNRLDSQRNEELRERLQQGRLRRELEGIRAELEHRLRPASVGSLRRVAPSANRMLRQLDALLDGDGKKKGSVGAGAVADFKERLKNLLEEAKRLDQLDAERRAMVELLDRSIRAAGFERLPQGQIDESRESVELRYVQRHAAQQAQIRSSIPLEGEITLEMLGPKGPRSFLLGPDAACDSNVRRIVEEARKLGLEIRAVGVGKRGPSLGSVSSGREHGDELRRQAELGHREGRAC
jgi:hypothetical protein